MTVTLETHPVFFLLMYEFMRIFTYSLVSLKLLGWTSLRHTWKIAAQGRNLHRLRRLFLTCLFLVCYSQMCLKEQWRNTVHCQLNICSTGHLFVCLWSNTQRKWAKHALERWWARKPRVKWSPTWEKEGPRPRIPGLGRKWPISFYTK